MSDPAPNTIENAIVMRGHVNIRLINSDVILSATCVMKQNSSEEKKLKNSQMLFFLFLKLNFICFLQ